MLKKSQWAPWMQERPNMMAKRPRGGPKLQKFAHNTQLAPKKAEWPSGCPKGTENAHLSQRRPIMPNGGMFGLNLGSTS